MPLSIVKYADKLLGKLGEDGGNFPPADDVRGSRLAEADMPITEMEFVVFDTELTGLKAKKDSIVSIGAIKMRRGMISLGESFYRVVEPRTELTARSVVIHEIMPSEAAGWPAIEHLLPEFLSFCGNAVLVGHMVSIDLQFLNTEMKRLYGAPLRNPAIDTYKLYAWIREKEENLCAFHGGLSEAADLFTLAKKYRIPVQKAHNAIADAFITAQLFQRLISQAPRWGLATVGDLVRVGGP